MKILAKYLHGSEDSIDVDVVYIVDALPNFEDCRKFCSGNKEENRNLATIKGVTIEECFIGSPDELNNSLIATYKLHEQECPMTLRPVERDVFLKFIRATRIILTLLTRTQYRVLVKSALKSYNLANRLDALKQIDISDIQSFGAKGGDEDVLKKIAFQCGQYILLLEGIEVYTKHQICEHFPDLTPYIYRRPVGNRRYLQKYLEDIIERHPSFEQDDKIALYRGKRYDIKTERILTIL